MPVCARAIQQPDGTLLLALDPAAPDLSACPYVVETGSANAWQELGNLSLVNASEISAYVGLVWAIAWGIKTIAKSFFYTNGNENE